MNNKCKTPFPMLRIGSGEVVGSQGYIELLHVLRRQVAENVAGADMELYDLLIESNADNCPFNGPYTSHPTDRLYLRLWCRDELEAWGEHL